VPVLQRQTEKVDIELVSAKRAYVKWVFVSFLACLDMLRARAYSPTVAALWLRIQTFLNRANVHLRDSALARNLF
jgi:hypothetical protein